MSSIGSCEVRACVRERVSEFNGVMCSMCVCVCERERERERQRERGREGGRESECVRTWVSE